MKRFPTTLALLIGLAAHCLGQEPDELPGPKNPTALDQFILEGMMDKMDIRTEIFGDADKPLQEV